MKILPAIDIYNGKAVRLFQGNYNNMTIYNDDPVSVAKNFESLGSEWIHVVDLEGAKIGKGSLPPHSSRIARSIQTSTGAQLFLP